MNGRRRVPPHVAAFEAARATDVTAAHICDLLDAVEDVLVMGTNKTDARRALDRAAAAATAASLSIRDVRDDWADVRVRILSQYHRESRPLPHVLRVILDRR